MIDPNKRKLPVRHGDYIFSKSLGRFYGKLTFEDMVKIMRLAVKEGVFIKHADEAHKWYVMWPCEKIKEDYIIVVLEDKNHYWWVKTLFSRGGKFERSVYISVKSFFNLGDNYVKL